MNRELHPNASPGGPRRSRVGALLLFTLAFVLGGLALPYLDIRAHWRAPESLAATEGLQVQPGPLRPLSPDEVYARAAQAANPAVVNIDIRKQVRVRPGFFEDWMMDEPRYEEAGSQGSGVIISKNGDILTNEHVVGGVNEANRTILVTLHNGKKYEGVVVGSDHTTDVALVKIKADNLPVAKMGTVRGLIPGQMTVAIGNPFGFRFTVTQGVVSALDRPINSRDGRVYEKLIQTDCAINPGNSGGALINLHGEVIGINTIVLGSAQGIGFAIPIDTALRVANDLKRYGKIKRPWLGVVVVTNTARTASAFDLPDVAGVFVGRLYRNSPAAEAGVRPGDIIVRVNGQPVRSEEDFKNIEKKLKIGQRIEIAVQRQDQRGRGTLTVGEAP